MKIVCISDTHNHHRVLEGKLPPGDMLIHAGDIAIHGSISEIQDFIDWFALQPYRYKLFVGGNHDGSLEKAKDQIRIPDQVTYLENTVAEIEGLRIWGSPVSPPYRSFGFMWDDERREKLYQQIPDGCDIIINHSPPFGILDQVSEGGSVGCPFLAERLATLNPRLVVCGHIHEGYGIMARNGITYVNASIMTRRYQPTNYPILVEL